MISDPDVIGILYLVTIVCFVVALKFLSSPKHARKGNWIGGAGMLLGDNVLDRKSAGMQSLGE